MTSSQSASDIRNNKPSRVIPAQFTRISTVPCVSKNAALAASIAARSATSTARLSAEPPAATIASATAPHDPSERLTQMT